MIKQIHKPDYIYIIHNIQITSICNHPVIFGGSQGYFFNDFWRNDEGLAASQLRLRHLQQGQLLWPRLILWMGQRKSESPVENDGKHPMIYRVSTCFNHPFGWFEGKNQWIGVRENPMVFTIKYRAFRFRFFHHPIL